jgi:hypothetical protein
MGRRNGGVRLKVQQENKEGRWEEKGADDGTNASIVGLFPFSFSTISAIRAKEYWLNIDLAV